MKQTDPTNTVSWVLAKILPKCFKKFLRSLYTVFSPGIIYVSVFLDGVLWLNYNPRYQIKKFLYNKHRNRLLKKYNIPLVNEKDMSPAITEVCDSDNVPRILTIIPYWEIGGDKFCSGNFFSEIFLSATERYGTENVRKLGNISDENWIETFKSEILSFNPNYLIMDVEHDPVESDWWSLDVFLIQLRASGWTGKIILIAYDSVWDSTRLHIDRITDRVHNVIVVTIDRPYLRRNNHYVRYLGPVILPISAGTLDVLRKLRLSSSCRESNSIFVGSLYGYRKIFLESLSFQAKSALVMNPQGKSASYYNYLKELGKALSTINFSWSSGKKLRQLKWRVMEAALLGCVVITDGENWIKQYLPELKLIGFRNIKTLEQAILTELKIQNMSVEVNSKQYFAYIEDLVTNSFWNQIVC